MKPRKIKRIKAWMYVWEDGEKQVLFKRLTEEAVLQLELKEVKVEILLKPPKK